MKYTLSTSEAMDMLRADEYASWSYKGARAMVEYLEQLEEDIGEEIEFDRVGIRCDYTEYESALEAAEELLPDSWKDDLEEEASEEQIEEAALSALNEYTTVIEFDGGVIVQGF